MKIGGQQIPTRTVLLASSEAGLVSLGLFAAMTIGRHLAGPAPVRAAKVGIAQLALVAITYELFLYYSEIYDLQLARNRAFTAMRLLQAFGLSSIVLAVVYAAIPSLSLEKGVVMIATPLIMTLLLAWRRVLSATASMFRTPETVAVLGTGPVGIAVVREICARPEINWKVIGFLDQDPKNVGKPLVNPGIIATIADLGPVVRSREVNRILISLKPGDDMPAETLLNLKMSGVLVEDASTVLERLTGRLPIEDPNWLVRTDGFRISRFYAAMKRLADVLISATLLFLLLPVFVVVAILIARESGSPVLFRQKRIGLHRKPFEILKFRSMYLDSEDGGPKWAADGDQRITPVGRVIRKYRLDELPQLWNVLRGDMSMIGPRPEQPYFCELLEAEVPFFAQRHQIRPGITGWAQIKYGYAGNVEDAARKLEHDLFYIKHMSLLLDTVIFFETAKVVIWARGAK